MRKYAAHIPGFEEPQVSIEGYIKFFEEVLLPRAPDNHIQKEGEE